jgi:hypothetical protein
MFFYSLQTLWPSVLVYIAYAVNLEQIYSPSFWLAYFRSTDVTTTINLILTEFENPQSKFEQIEGL